MRCARFLLLGGPATTGVPVLSGRAKRAGSNAPSFPNSIWERNCLRNSIAWVTRNTCALFFLFGLLLTVPPFAHAQTNTTDASAPATNAPAYFAPSPASAPVTPPLNLSNGPDQTSPQADKLEDIRPPFFFLHSWLWLWIALGIAAVITLLILVWFWLRPHRLLSPKSAYELTLEKLEKARTLLREDNPMPYAILISETIRSYLGQRFQAPSTRRTTEEFLRQMEADRTTPLAEHRDLLRDFLQSCDLVKFARYQPTLTELEQVQQRAATFVNATKPPPAGDKASHPNGRHP
jgi:hypothetical protein